MKLHKLCRSIVMLAGLQSFAAAADTHAQVCDRACLKSAADKVLASMVAHNPSELTLSKTYRATENSVPAALSMMTLWRTPTAIKHTYYVIDTKAGQLFIVADVAEGSNDALVFGRIKIVGRAITELELYDSRSRGDVGFQFDARGLADWPEAWTVQLAASQRSSRAALLRAGQSIFDTRVESPSASPACVLMENGKVVEENPAVLKEVMPTNGHDSPLLKLNSHGLVTIPCGVPPGRPTDPHARVDVIDEEQSIVVSIATVQGMVEPYLVTRPTESAFVPVAMLQPYLAMLTKQRAVGHYTIPAMEAMPASITVAQMHRIYDDKLQAMQMLQKLGPAGARSPWVPN
ncbi:hypothetical protein NUV25_35195 [Burkholderia pseudomultivorans]|uniref:hypothetical protein n=1 Tax=Burkholderia pseudomultivorans TaxID=1207504 RepID=UPI002874C466|nr:hypothetical protein [Burkholderia pseudomultivorans]MDS0862958.1 hypothetical protein [Burkholderia pseudomultivorans]